MKDLDPDKIEAAIGYRLKTTFFGDFSRAEPYGESAIRDTYDRAFENWHTDVTYMTELVMILNWKIWQHHEENNPALVDLYTELWETADHWCLDNLKGDDLSYFLSTTD